MNNEEPVIINVGLNKDKLQCSNCFIIFNDDTNIIQYGPIEFYHLTCFNKMFNIDIDKLLKPYSKEMICETLELKEKQNESN